jgi:hypothetical protein
MPRERRCRLQVRSPTAAVDPARAREGRERERDGCVSSCLREGSVVDVFIAVYAVCIAIAVLYMTLRYYRLIYEPLRGSLRLAHGDALRPNPRRKPFIRIEREAGFLFPVLLERFSPTTLRILYILRVFFGILAHGGSSFLIPNVDIVLVFFLQFAKSF